ncbi:MAG TPA: thiamine pyrophosphate-dependent dehydrogenase E1 component subunit alpha [Thermoplasmata archaeon]|nr:thiamine pyrophosphate-dependent dehydrogenase E1 component subunit alpha [Thermoplasmata archaeon]
MGEASVVPSSVATPQDPEFPSEQLLKAYQAMVVVRVTDERCLTLQRQGRIGFYVPLQGQEAAQVGCAWALKPEDWIFPAYRELGVALVRGIPLQLVLDQLFGNSGDELKGRQMPNHYGYRRFNFVTASSPVGTQISHAVGAAMAAQRKGASHITITFFGDGTTSSNDFHAGLNFAGVFQTPTIFFCQNNQWAISLPREKQTHSKTLAEKAIAYGIAGVVVDGMDVRAVYRAVTEARNRALSGGGPTLIEAQVYRLGPHSTSDDPKRYRTDAELADWKAKDPIARLKRELLDAGTLTEAADTALWESAKELLSKAVQKSESVGPVPPMSIFDDVFGSQPPLLQEERRELEQLFNQGVVRP